MSLKMSILMVAMISLGLIAGFCLGVVLERTRRKDRPAPIADPTPDRTGQGDAQTIVTAAERAYGTLWRHYGLAAGYAYDARKLLLAVIGKEGQRRGIAWSNEKYGPLGPDPRSMLSEEDQREMGL